MSLEKLKENKIEEVRREIMEINKQNSVYGTYETRLSDEAAKAAYEEILGALHEIPGLSIDDIIQLEKEIQQRINTIGKYRNSEYNIDNVSDEKKFRKAVERVHYQHRYDAGAMFGTLSADEAERAYNTLLELLNDVIGLSDSFKAEMTALIERKITEIPKVELEKIEEYKRYQAKAHMAFNQAKARFNELGFFKKLKLRREGMAPEQIDVDIIGIEGVNALYRK